MAKDLKALADAAADRYGVPRHLFRKLIQQESGWNPDAHNPSGATGLAQIHLPSHPDISEEQARDPAFALGWGARYLAAQKAQFGNWRDALAAYNAGPGNVKSGKWKSFPETRNYVQSILGGGGEPAAVPKTPSLPLVEAALGKPAASPDLVGSVFASNNALLGVDTPDFITSLLTAPPKMSTLAAAPVAATSAPPQGTSSVTVSGFVPAFQTALNRLLKDTGLTINSGYRSNERQAELFAAAVKKYGSEAAARKWVAPPGKSRHNHGDAADLGGDLSVLSDTMLRRYGLYRPMPYEPWHVEPSDPEAKEHRMPSVSVPLKTDTAKWAALMKQRREFWAKPGNMQLSPHFSATEFYCNDGSACPTTARPAMVKLCTVFLEPMRAKFGACLVLSGYRHVLYNATIGGARESQHIYEQGFESVAADLRFERGTPAQWAAEARRLRAKTNNGRGGVGRYDRSGFVHCDNRLWKADWSG